MADEPRRPTEEEMRAKLAEAAPKEGRETRAEADERRRQERRARRRARRQRNQPPPGPTPEEMKRNEIKAEADAILESWRASFTAGLRAKESSDEELDEKTGKMRKLTVKERKRRRKLREVAMRRAAAKARGGKLAWVVAAYRKYLASKRADGTRAGREYRIQTVTVDSKGKEIIRPDESGAKFPPSLMDQQAFLVLEAWALHHKITQGEMYKVYEAYYDNLHAKKHPDDSHKIPNRISTYYFQDLFDHSTAEATSLILIPLLFVKELHGLKRARDVGCITFPRFLIAGYEFARQSPCGVILKFFRLLLDPQMIAEDALVPLKPFEDLVSLCVEINQCVGCTAMTRPFWLGRAARNRHRHAIEQASRRWRGGRRDDSARTRRKILISTQVSLMHGGTPKAHLHLFSSLFGEKTHVRFPELVRACCACPVLLRPLRLFHLQLQRKFFWSEFWSRHQLPCLDPVEEELFGPLMVAPSLERSLVNYSTLEKSWRLTARRLLGWIRIRTTKSSSSYWLELELDECRDLDDSLDSIYIFETTNLLRDMYGLRFGKLLADLLFDNKSFAIGALHDAIWRAYDTPIRVAMVAGGTDLNAQGETTATPRRRAVREWPAPVPQDGDDFLRRRPADAMTLGWQKFTDPATDREFHYHVASHTSQWLDPRHDYTFAGHDGRATYFWPERAEELRARRRTMGDLALAGLVDEPAAAPAPAPAPAERQPTPKLSLFGRLSKKKKAEGAAPSDSPGSRPPTADPRPPTADPSHPTAEDTQLIKM